MQRTPPACIQRPGCVGACARVGGKVAVVVQQRNGHWQAPHLKGKVGQRCSECPSSNPEGATAVGQTLGYKLIPAYSECTAGFQEETKCEDKVRLCSGQLEG
mmetsp:Transcript_38582/g.69080  ORF Transcript_38582/g.69080 Transcript_38582/m.69080 type:complete len:102 (-) Transcript_38582:972-1277(-)